MKKSHSKPRKMFQRNQSSMQAPNYRTRALLVVLTVLLSSILVNAGKVLATTSEKDPATVLNEQQTSKQLPANHRMEDSSVDTKSESPYSGLSGRSSRQYDGSMSASGTGSYAALSTDAGAYLGSQLPLMSGSGVYGPSSSSSGASASGVYANDVAAGAYHEPIARGYSPMHHSAGGYGGPGPLGPHQPPFGPLSAMFSGGGGGMFSNSMFPITAKGFDVSEIICSAIAVAIGAVIVGAPFILLYLFVMNQMGGNSGPNALGPSGGAISLTGPSSSTTVSGRKKRHTTFPEALFKQLSPLVNNEQLASTFKMLLNSIAKHQV